MAGISQAQSPESERQTKVCTKCRIEKPRAAFVSTPNKRGPDKPRYLVSNCKSCQEATRRAAGARSAEEVRQERRAAALIGSEVRFWRMVDKSGPIPVHCPELGNCWTWKGGRHAQFGYGMFSVTCRAVTAHRFSWQLANGAISSEVCVLHKCDNPPCCNPAHLFTGTRTDNANDKVSKGRQSRLRGTASPRAILTDEAVLEMRRRRAEEGATYSALGAAYGVNRGTARQAVIGATNWSHLKGGLTRDPKTMP